MTAAAARRRGVPGAPDAGCEACLEGGAGERTRRRRALVDANRALAAELDTIAADLAARRLDGDGVERRIRTALELHWATLSSLPE